ncbi:hypothetical protein E5676_scaffold874G00100 [Cucumis melo var. makuwa]|uniref:Uncharacterized protein n=1 Tax=Cucumis melo var. makuwa TaxID=1194695 RepID=A0A5D3CHY9_CUCMM|nr:hypothetical protein E5676_scaffold874G00100 [Cucumis melo var. makuwa]
MGSLQSHELRLKLFDSTPSKEPFHMQSSSRGQLGGRRGGCGSRENGQSKIVGSQCTILTDNYCEDAYHLLQTPLLKNLLMDEKKERRRFADGEKESKTMEQAWVVGQGGTGSGLRIE